MLRFHARTFELLAQTPRADPRSIAALDNAEARIGRALPASVREWYSQAGACTILNRFSNHDPAVPIARLGTPAAAKQGLMHIRRENQGVCRWAVRLDDTDDPEVVVAIDPDFRTWLPYAPSFSTYVYTCVWDYTHVLRRDLCVHAQNQPLSSETLAALRARYTTEPSTSSWPTRTTHRFRAAAKSIIIWDNPDQADWFVAGDDAPALEQLLREVWTLDNLSTALFGHAAIAEQAIARAGLSRPN